MTLNQTWKNCLRMWKWIAKNWEPGANIRVLKRQWFCKYKPQLDIESDCFFCEYQSQHNTKVDTLIIPDCMACPGKLVSKHFNCCCKTYNYEYHPKKFYQKLLQLDAKRKGN
jgi:hypothetical protein